MNSQLHTFNSPKISFFTTAKPSLLNNGTSIFHVQSLQFRRRKQQPVRKAINARTKKPEPFSPARTSVLRDDEAPKVRAVTTIKDPSGSLLSRVLDKIGDWWRGEAFVLELVSTNLSLDPGTGNPKTIKTDDENKIGQEGDEITFESDLITIPKDFEEIGAVFVENYHREEIYFKDIVIKGLPSGDITFTCNSWVQPRSDKHPKRIFFSNKSYLPSNTPDGLKNWREWELENKRGKGHETEEREKGERIYDYDVYNDLGDPDNSHQLARPVLGGKKHPYPRRCRTNREKCKKDRSSESRKGDFYVPRDEEFSEVKNEQFQLKTLGSAVHSLIPFIESTLVDKAQGFPYFTAIDSLFNEGIRIAEKENKGIFEYALPRLLKAIDDTADKLLLFEVPEILHRDKFAWVRDDEFARQTLAGLNPYSIELVTEWPLKSKLDPEIYGPAESLITTNLVERQIGGEMTVKSALDNKRLFMLDYHDAYLPYVHKIRELEGRSMYGSRTLFFLTDEGTLRPIAIELTRPKNGDRSEWRDVFTPSWDATTRWLWKLAKAHVCAHDTGYHQLVQHWLRTHCCVEPYIIAANRQLSSMHPIYRLLHPHFRYTMEINALARQSLINAGGVIESNFLPGKYSMELSSVVYDKTWRFDMEALPADLIRRGMAVEDPSAKHGIRLTIEDYPFANDGLVLWDAITDWVTEYVNYYYPESSTVISDNELQAWWTEVRTRGHEDKKDEPWWPVLNTPQDLISVLTNIIWVVSGHHAAVNFGQYMYAGYFPFKPTITRTNMPSEEPTMEKFLRFREKPELEFLECLPSQIQATTVMTVLDVLSTHSPDEEYIGEKIEPAWEADPYIKGAFEKFNGSLKRLEGIIDERNADFRFKNRAGAGVVPYELLKPLSNEGVTGKGVPNSISI